MALYKKEVLVRSDSTLDFATSMTEALNWLTTTFQDATNNIDINNNYIDYYFADVVFVKGHFTNSEEVWRIYTSPCGAMYNMTAAASGRIEYKIIDKITTIIPQKYDFITTLNQTTYVITGVHLIDYVIVNGVMLHPNDYIVSTINGDTHIQLKTSRELNAWVQVTTK